MTRQHQHHEGSSENRRRPQKIPQATTGDNRKDQRPQETTGEINIKCGAKLYATFAIRDKANAGLYRDIWSLIES